MTETHRRRPHEEGGAEQADQDLPKSVTPRRELVCTYSYQIPDGNEWFQKLRWRVDGGRGKAFTYRYRVSPTRVWVHRKREDADRLIYHLPDVLHAVKDGREIVWAEGEKDADAAVDAGYVATSHHGGAGKINADQASCLKGHRGLVLLAYDLDEDGPGGGNPGAFDVIRRYDLLRGVGLAASQIYVGGPAVGKDLADHLAAGHPVEDLVWLDSLAELRAKAERTTSGSMGWANYRGGLPEGFTGLKTTVIKRDEMGLR